tara:strand:+ start:1053 stop:1205 length:153 start_codon:yes stop_codon:yes gene_type:complete
MTGREIAEAKDWDIIEVLKVTIEALRESNAHEEVRRIKQILYKLDYTQDF